MRPDDLDAVLKEVSAGSADARNRLFAGYRELVKRVVRSRMDPRLSARVDSSDVVQEVFATAESGLDEYLRTRPADFYVWIRGIAEQRLVDMYRRHVVAAKRSVRRETPAAVGTEDDPVREREPVAGSQTSPSQQVIRTEQSEALRRALEVLSPDDREVIALRYLERLTMPEVAVTLGISLPAAKSRHLRAIARLTELMKDSSTSDA
jgi:RNA polymerase sigma-70 factor (ECF subfamily)